MMASSSSRISSLLGIFAFIIFLHVVGTNGCIENERRALLALKTDIYQPPQHEQWLSSWKAINGGDCCIWQGVDCDNKTGHVTKLDLRYPFDWIFSDYDGSFFPSPSKLSSSLLDLKHLMYLDLSLNNFSGSPIPEFIGSLPNLEYLNLSNANFGGVVPPQIGNLSRLYSLDLNCLYYYSLINGGNNLHWLSQISSLRYLDMSGVNLSMVSGHLIIHDLNRLPSLSVLKLSNVRVNSIPATLEHVNFTSLAVLDLSSNNFAAEPTIMPNWILNISSLVHLDLDSCSIMNMKSLEMLIESSTGCNLSFLNLGHNDINGEIPDRLGNLSRLELLNLYGNQLHGRIPETVGSLVHLQHLDLSGNNNISGELPETIGNMKKLQYLDLSSNRISGELPEIFGSLKQLQYLDLSGNRIGGELPETIGSIKQLQYLVLSGNRIGGELPEAIGSIKQLQYLDLSDNMIGGELPETIGSIKQLQDLDLSGNRIGGELPETIGNMKKLQFLDLSFNMINGQLPQTLYKLSNLQMLILGGNNISGLIPESLGQLSRLVSLDLTDNSFTGKLTEAHFATLSNLDNLGLSYNNNLELILSQNWIPPFNASVIMLCSCGQGPEFPAWLKNQTKLEDLCLSDNGISGTIPAWFSDFKNLGLLNLSHNAIGGHLSVLPQVQVKFGYVILDLSYNNFDGYIPLHLLSSNQMGYLSLSHNRLSGNVPSDVCNFTRMQILDLSNNNFSGSLPSCQNGSSGLQILDLSNNFFSGHIPDLMGFFYPQLQSLHLRNNSFVSKIPRSLKHCQQLVVLDLGENRLSGNIPKWIGKSLSALRVLSLRSNYFYGRIPTQLSYLSNLQVLDLAHNNLSSTLSPSIGNLMGMAVKMNGSNPFYKYSLSDGYYWDTLLMTRNGILIEYIKILPFVVSIDISSNNLYGQIPAELTNLIGLQALNLSKNNLTGDIPGDIGAMKQLETLDLSMNNLSGKIPPSISLLNFLAHFNLSNNNLSGRIPTGNQLQTLNDPSIYAGNLALCGSPLPQCPGDDPFHGPPQKENRVPEENEDKREMIWFCASIAMGFIVGFWGFQGTLLIKSSLRIAYFRFTDNVFDWIYVKLALSFARLKSTILKDTRDGYRG